MAVTSANVFITSTIAHTAGDTIDKVGVAAVVAVARFLADVTNVFGMELR